MANAGQVASSGGRTLAKAKRKTNPNSPWRKKNGGLGPLSAPDPDAPSEHIPGVLDAEFFETPARLTRKELEELL